MERTENVSLASLTTFKVGGIATYVVECATVADIQTALRCIRERSLSWYVIGGGSNILASDDGFNGVIIRPLFTQMVFEDVVMDTCVVRAGAGTAWDSLVQESVTRKLWGLENLAGIPGLVGGAPVQNIGAYGADVSETLIYVDAFDTQSGEVTRFPKEECLFGYRDSRFKHDARYIILEVAFSLSAKGTPRTNYADITKRIQEGIVLDTSERIAEEVRAIRAHKFPDLTTSGTAGSFFKNPYISAAKYADLLRTYPALPGFSDQSGNIKIPLAWILDHVLKLRGYTKGPVRCFEQQPLVIVTEEGATAAEVELFAQEIEKKVFEVTGIAIEREVRMLQTK